MPDYLKLKNERKLMPAEFTKQEFNPKTEEAILEFWEEGKVFEKSLEQTKNGKPFTFYDGPPFATGTPHYGSLLSSIIKDVVGRYQTMKGRFVRRRWGWDCHGLPIEEIVERELGISGKKKIEEIGIDKFNETCRTMVLQYVAEWRKMIRRIARWVDFDNSYKTMDRDYMESVWWAFKELHKKGLVYEGRKVLLYCPRCETPVSNFEVAMDNSYKDVTEEAVTVKFKVVVEGQTKGLNLPPNKNTFLLAWTTTPWTLPGNVALAVSSDPNLKYGVFERGKEAFVIAMSRAGAYGFGSQEPRVVFPGSQLRGVKYEPLYKVPAMETQQSYKVYGASFVTAEEGTGIVHTAVVYGEDDYLLGTANKLPIVPLLDEKGIFNDKAPELVRGQYFKKADKIVIEDLEARKLFLAKAAHTHSYPHCWRCGTALFYNAIPAWFVNVQKLKPKLLKSNEKEINWFPAHLKLGRYAKSMEQAPDWNISRNRYWGNPVPVWHCKQCGKDMVVGSVQELGLGTNTLYFSRHGLAESNVRGIHSPYRENDPVDLVPEGIGQMKAMGKQLKKMGGIDLIVASDVRRTKHSAEILAGILKCPVEYDVRLREYNMGTLNYTTYTGVNGIEKMLPLDDRWTKAPEGGETWTDLQERMVAAVKDINKKYNYKRILIISHGDPLWVLRKYFGSEKGYPEIGGMFQMNVDINDLHRPGIDAITLSCTCGGKAKRVKEIFDSWMEAGSMPFAEYHYPFEQKEIFESRLPAQFVAEYIPQTRAWFYVMHVVSLALFGKVPFENVVTTGTVLAEDGSKMSKSKRNYPDPWEVISKYGSDSLRLYLMHSPVMQAKDLNFSVRELEALHRKVVLMLMNVEKYFVTYAREAGWKKNNDNKDNENVLDRWIMVRTKELVNETTKYFDGYDTVRATRQIEEYITDLSTWYVRRSRGRKENSFFSTLCEVLETVSKVIAPVMPYSAEYMYQALSEFGNSDESAKSVHLAEWPKQEKMSVVEVKLVKDMNLARDLASKALAARKAAGIPVRQPLVALKIQKKELEGNELLLSILKDEVNVKNVVVNPKLTTEIELETAISSELKREGLVRGLERAIQKLRKKQGLKVGEKVSLIYWSENAELKEAMQHIDTQKTYLISVKEAESFQGEEVVLEGGEIILGFKKITSGGYSSRTLYA